ncbi:hypothetical protein DM01DRAFT_1340292 [Hesseltinella vesiculosa]|uniref:F-box domain-containing protein n=1 Tax=Hesseltinella vesiculosa TaxID=101127 RepID=A0A1X2G4H3_9FUNG|nr:hypothetical protein DM01DRAFT_1340292 [Hesseltinella vesiculosa]
MSAQIELETKCHRSLTELPLEVLVIVDLLLDLTDRKELRFVNRYLNRVVTPRLFRTISFPKSKSNTKGFGGLQQILPLSSCRSIIDHLECQQHEHPTASLAQHVQAIQVNRDDIIAPLVCQLLNACPAVWDVTLDSMVLRQGWSIEWLERNDYLPMDLDTIQTSLGNLLRGRPNINKLRLVSYRGNEMRSAFLRLLPDLGHLRSLELDCFVWYAPDPDDWPSILPAIQKHCPDLTTLVCYFSRDDYYDAIGRWLMAKEDGRLDAAIQPWKSITNLSVDFADPTDDPYKLSRLVHFIGAKFPSLTSLTLAFSGAIKGSKPWMEFPRLCLLHLVSLKIVCNQGLAECLSVFGKFASTTTSNLTSLELDLTNSDLDVATVLSRFPSLQRLRIDSNGKLTCSSLGQDHPPHALMSLTVGRKTRYGASFDDGSALETISRICLSLEHLDVTLDCWNSSAPCEAVKEAFIKSIQHRFDGLIVSGTGRSQQPRFFSMSQASNLTRLTMSLSYCAFDGCRGLIILAILPTSPTDLADSIYPTVYNAWCVERQAGSRNLTVKTWGNDMPSALAALVNWDTDLDGVTLGDVGRLEFVGIIFLPSPPKHIHIETNYLMKK